MQILKPDQLMNLHFPKFFYESHKFDEQNKKVRKAFKNNLSDTYKSLRNCL